MKEEWRPIVIDGKVHLWYSVSNHGNARSHLRQESLGNYGSRTIYDPNFYKDLTQYPAKNRDGSVARIKLNLKFPDDFFEDYQYVRASNCTVSRDCSMHELVMGAFRPMDEYPPDRLKEDWNSTPESAKTWIKESVYINHIDHDPSNNRVDNLEYVTPRENARAAIRHYGGNVANKGKQNNDEFIIVTEPKFNLLLQEWEDGDIEFLGEKGEECYNMLEEIAKQRDESVRDTFFDIVEKYINEKECELNENTK